MKGWTSDKPSEPGHADLSEYTLTLLMSGLEAYNTPEALTVGI